MRRSLANPSTSDVFSQPRHTNPTAVLRLKWGKRGGSFFFFKGVGNLFFPLRLHSSCQFPAHRRVLGRSGDVWAAGGWCWGPLGCLMLSGALSWWEKQAIRCLARSQVGQRENLLVAELIAASHSSQMEHRNPRDPCCRAQEVPQWPVKISCFFTVQKAPPSLTPQDSAHDFFLSKENTQNGNKSVLEKLKTHDSQVIFCNTTN